MIDLILQILGYYALSLFVSIALIPKFKPFNASNRINHLIMWWFATKRNKQLKELTGETNGLWLYVKASYAPHTIKNLHKDEFKWIKTDMWERLIK